MVIIAITMKSAAVHTRPGKRAPYNHKIKAGTHVRLLEELCITPGLTYYFAQVVGTGGGARGWVKGCHLRRVTILDDSVLPGVHSGSSSGSLGSNNSNMQPLQQPTMGIQMNMMNIPQPVNSDSYRMASQYNPGGNSGVMAGSGYNYY